jgi:hypothetical protein
VRRLALLRSLARHAEGYANLAEGAVREHGRAIARRVALAAAAITLVISGIVIAGTWLLLVSWESPSRDVVAIALVLGLLVPGGVCGWLFLTPRDAGPIQRRLEREWSRDRELLGEWWKSA